MFVQQLLQELAPVISVTRASQIPLHVKLLLTLWTLANQESFRQIGDRFGMNRGNAHIYYIQVCGGMSRQIIDSNTVFFATRISSCMSREGSHVNLEQNFCF